MSEKLVACPGCGATPYLEYWDQDYHKGDCRYCCNCDWHTLFHDTEEEARAAWNKRIYPAKVRAVLEAAKRMMDYPSVEFEEEFTEYSILYDELKAAVRALEEEEDER